LLLSETSEIVNVIVAPAVRGMLLALVLAVTACSPDATARDRTSTPSNAAKAASNPNPDVVDLGVSSYRVVSLSAVGSVSGAVTRSDSTAMASADLARDSLAVECGSSPAPVARRRSLMTVSNAVVWIAGVTAGKGFSEEKRAELESDDCGLDPGTLAIAVGTTVNVINDDRVLHRLIFTREGAHDTIATMPFFNEGEIVASERLGKTPGVVDVTCAFHRSTRGRVAIFAHPYFATTDDAGRFIIDSLPPGTYALHVWPVGAKRPTEQRVTVVAGETAKSDVKLAAGY
jgi:plastocyanin